MNLEQAFKSAAYKVWNELEPVANPNHVIFPVREEALTSMALKALVNSNCSLISKVEMISTDEEKTNGYDFELVIGSKSSWIRFFIQSKRLYGYSVNDNYDAIKYDQAEKLIKYSKNKSVGIPTYAFYNHLNENDLILSKYYNSITFFDRESLGITLTSALSVKMLKSKKFKDHHFNHGIHAHTHLKALKSFEHLYYFYSSFRNHMSIPFHDLSYLTIELAEQMNRLHKKKQRKNIAPFFFFFFPGFENLIGGEDDLIPILRDTNIDVIISDFRNRAMQNTSSDFGYNPKALVIINTNE